MAFFIEVDSAGLVVGYQEGDTPPDSPYALHEVAERPAFGAAPSPTCALHWNSGAPEWVETASMDDLRAEKNAEINAARMAANFSHFTYSGKQIACDALSRSDIDAVNGYVSLTGAFRTGWKGAWKAMDNTYLSLATVDDWKAFYAAMIDQGQANFDHAQSLKASLASATTAEQIAAITW